MVPDSLALQAFADSRARTLGLLDVLSEREPLSHPPYHRNQLPFGVIRAAAMSTGAAGGEVEVGVGVGVGCGMMVAAVFSVTHKTQEPL